MGRLLNIVLVVLIALWAIQEFSRFFDGTATHATLPLALGLCGFAVLFSFITYIYWNEEDDF